MVRRILITGSTGGIGLATAKAFLSEGAEVFIHGRDTEKLSNLLAELSKDYPNKVFGFAADLTKEKDRVKLTIKVIEVFDTLDSLVLCVGNGNVKKGVFLHQKDWDAILSQNFFGNIHMISALFHLLNETIASNICFIGSIAGLQYTKAPTAYSVAKAALDTYSKCLSVALADHDIRVNIVHPGNVYFPGGRWEELQSIDSEGVTNYIESEVAQKRFGTPEEIAETILFLCSSKASFITGTSLIVDGGQVKSF